MKKILYLNLIFLLLFSLNISANEDTKLINKISKNLRCIVCQGQSVYDSQSEFAISVKSLIQKKIKEGKNEEEIYTFFEQRYGEWILYNPRFSKNTIFLWLFPLILFLLAAIYIARRITIK